MLQYHINFIFHFFLRNGNVKGIIKILATIDHYYNRRVNINVNIIFIIDLYYNRSRRVNSTSYVQIPIWNVYNSAGMKA